MGFADSYYKKNQFIKLNNIGVPNNSGLLRYIVIIPAYCEPDIFKTLESLKNCQQPINSIEVHILVNYSESDSEEIKNSNHQLFNTLEDWCSVNQLDWLTFYPFITPNLTKKHAGAGLARKILMDNAVGRFSKLNCSKGLIFSLDADTIVPENYFTKVESHEATDKNWDCYIFNFNHPTSGAEYSNQVYTSITLYELHLRYFKQILESTGFPFYLYTIGSCFAVKAQTYVSVGGMSKRKAGEDFYFLQKVFAFGQSTFLSNIVLKPSPRPSWRVPFGTGPAIRKMLGEVEPEYLTYHPDLFTDIAQLVTMVPRLYNAEKEIITELTSKLSTFFGAYMEKVSLSNRLDEINKNSSTRDNFIKRFYNWFDGFQVIKYLNYVSEKHTPLIEVTDAVSLFLEDKSKYSASKLLEILRYKDR